MGSRARFADSLHAQFGALLDFQFAQLAPIPVLPKDVCERLGSYDVTIPPSRWFAPGNQDLTGLIYLVSIAKQIDARSIFEIGTYNGVTALTLAMNLPNTVVHTLDLAPDDNPELPVDDGDRSNFCFRSVARVFEAREESCRIVQHFGDSAKFDFSPFRKQIDVVYVDGAHTFDYVRNDSAVAFDMASEKSAIVWDDYGRRTPGVPRYLDSSVNGNIFRIPRSRLVARFSPGSVPCVFGGEGAERCITGRDGPPAIAGEANVGKLLRRG